MILDYRSADKCLYLQKKIYSLLFFLQKPVLQALSFKI